MLLKYLLLRYLVIDVLPPLLKIFLMERLKIALNQNVENIMQNVGNVIFHQLFLLHLLFV